MSRASDSESNYRVVKCRCGVTVALLKSWTQENPGRRFIKCKFSNPNSTHGCGYFRWYDEELIEWQRNKINQLILEKKVLECDLMMIKCENTHLLEQNQKLKEATAILRQIKAYDNEVMVNQNNNMKSSRTMLKWIIVVVCLLVVLFSLLLKL